MKRIWILLISTLFLTGAGQQVEDHELRLLYAFEQLGVKTERMNWRFSGHTDQPITHQEAQQVAEELFTIWQLQPRKLSPEKWIAVQPNWKAFFLLDSSRTYFVLQVTYLGQPYSSFIQKRQSTEKRLALAKLKPMVFFSIQGMSPMQAQILSQVIHTFHAKEIEGMRSVSLVSLSLYSPFLKGGIETQRGKMNLQIATRQSLEHRQQIVTVGTPMITIEY